MTLPDRAARFRELHAKGRLLVLANVWDAVTARLVESTGAEAIATSSAALAWAHGHADGERLPLDTLVAAVREIVAVVSVPVTIDLERGYADDPALVVEAMARVVDAGAVGVNLEDRAGPPEVLAAKIRACKAHPTLADVFLNARIDVFLHGSLPPERALEEALARGRAYADAGADGLFVPKVTAPAAIEALVSSTPLPLNVMAVPGLPSVHDLRACGVRRLSAGPWLAVAALGAVRRASADLFEHGTYDRLFDGDLSSVMALNKLFTPAPSR